MLYFIFFIISIFFETNILNIIKKFSTNIYNTIKTKEIFQENAHSLIHYIISSSIINILFLNNKYCINDYGLFIINKSCLFNLKLPYLYDMLILFETSYYIVSLLYLYFYKIIKRKDQKIMYFHHILTLILFRFSYFNDLTKILSIYVLFTHNLCDIPLNTYMLLENHKNHNKQIEKSIIFNCGFNIASILTIVFFGYLRIIMYGSLNLYLFLYPYNITLLVRLFLLILYGLNINWFYLMIIEIINKVYNKKNNFYE